MIRIGVLESIWKLFTDIAPFVLVAVIAMWVFKFFTGEHRKVKFGTDSNGESIYINAEGTHALIRQKLMPSGVGVADLTRTRAVLTEMHKTVMTNKGVRLPVLPLNPHILRPGVD